MRRHVRTHAVPPGGQAGSLAERLGSLYWALPGSDLTQDEPAGPVSAHKLHQYMDQFCERVWTRTAKMMLHSWLYVKGL